MRSTSICLFFIPETTGQIWINFMVGFCSQNCLVNTILIIECVGYVRTQLSCILFIMLMTTCFGHCGPSSGHKNDI